VAIAPIAAADFSCIRNAGLGRFTVDRLMSIINRLGSRVEVKIRVRRAETVARRLGPFATGRRSPLVVPPWKWDRGSVFVIGQQTCFGEARQTTNNDGLSHSNTTTLVGCPLMHSELDRMKPGVHAALGQ
jgi:hypothetical protein